MEVAYDPIAEAKAKDPAAYVDPVEAYNNMDETRSDQNTVIDLQSRMTSGEADKAMSQGLEQQVIPTETIVAPNREPQSEKNDSPGQKEIDKLKFANFSDDEINAYVADKTATLSKGKFTDAEIREYWGVVEPDTTAMKDFVKGNLDKAKEERAGANPDAPMEAVSFLDAFKAGMQNSTWDLAVAKPDMVLPKDANFAMQVMAAGAQWIGDIPAMAAGGFLGGMAGAGVGAIEGSVVPGLGTLAGVGAGVVVGGAAGAFGITEGLRQLYLDHYRKGDITGPNDFLARLSSVAWATIKGATVGAATAGTGKLVTAVGAGVYTKMASELATMTTVSSALEGHLPTGKDIALNAVMIGGMHGIGTVSDNLMSRWTKTGIMPGETLKETVTDPIIHQEMLQNPKPEVPKDSEVITFKDPTHVGDDAPKITYASTKLEPQTKETSLPDKGIKRTEAENAILAHIGESDLEAPKLPMRNRIQRMRNRIQRMRNDLHPFKEYFNEIKDKVNISPEDNFVATTKLYRNWTGKLDVFMKDGTYSAEYVKGTKDFKRTGDGFNSVLDKIPLADVVDEKTGKVVDQVSDDAGAIAYIASKRAVHLSERTNKRGEEIKTGFDLEAAKEVVKRGKRFEPFAKAFEAYGNRMLDYAEEMQLLSPEDRKKIGEVSLAYAPLNAVQEFDPFGGNKGSGGAKNLKRQSGSEAKKLNPIEQMYKNTAAILRVAERNKIGLQMLDAMEQNPEASANYVRKLKRDTVPIKVQVDEMRKALIDQGFEDADMLTDEHLKAFNIFRAKDVMIGNDNILRVKRNGVPEYLEISDGIADAMKALDIKPYWQNPMWKILTVPSKFLRLAVTKDPAFAQGTNVARDAGTALTTEGILPFSKTKETMSSIMNRKTDYIQMLLHGGASGDVQSHVEFLKEDVLKEYHAAKADTAIEAVWNRVKSPIQGITEVGAALENSTRLAAFNKRGGGVKGSLAARDATVDFTEGTQFTRAWSQVDAFFNPSVQGAARVVESFGPSQIKKTLKYGLGGITTLSVINWFRNKDRYEYITAKRWEKKNNWLFPIDNWEKAVSAESYNGYPAQMRRMLPDGTMQINNSKVLRFPKPPGFGQVFGSFAESLLDAGYDEYRKNPNASNLYTDLKEDMKQAVNFADIGSLVPDAVRPVLEQMTNHVFFTDQPIINRKLEELAPELQYKEYTTQTAKSLGKIISAVPLIGELGPDNVQTSSPLVVENYLRSWTGGLGKLATDIIDYSLKKAGISTDQHVMPSGVLADIPFVRAFVSRNPTMSSQVVTDFYSKAKDLDRQMNTARALYKEGEELLAANAEHPNPQLMARANGLMARAESISKQYAPAAQFAGGVSAAIKEQNILIKKVMLDDKMTPHDKRQIIDGVYWQMIEFSRLGNVKLKEFENTKQELH